MLLAAAREDHGLSAGVGDDTVPAFGFGRLATIVGLGALAWLPLAGAVLAFG